MRVLGLISSAVATFMQVAAIIAARSLGGAAIAESDRSRLPTTETPSASVLQEAVRDSMLPKVLSASSSRICAFTTRHKTSSTTLYEQNAPQDESSELFDTLFGFAPVCAFLRGFARILR